MRFPSTRYSSRISRVVALVLTLMMLAVLLALPMGHAIAGDHELSNPIISDEYEEVARLGGNFLAKSTEDGRKKVLYVEGSAYDRGYATAYLAPESVYRMTHDFMENVLAETVKSMFGFNVRALPFWGQIWQLLQILAASNQAAVPQEYLDEMRGLVDGCRARGYKVSMANVLTLNTGFDALLSLFYTVDAVIFCNAFAAFGNATEGGAVYHGRDFMFFTGGGVFTDEAALLVHKPDTGEPFVASAAPGFVGIPTGMNAQGVSCGLDMVSSIFTRPLFSGMGGLLMVRRAVQYGRTKDEAISLIRDTDRAVPWLFLVTDGKAPDAAVLETVASSMSTPPGTIPDFSRNLVMGLLSLYFPWMKLNAANVRGAVKSKNGRVVLGRGSLSDELGRLVPSSTGQPVVKGMMVRENDYVDPPWLEGLRYIVKPIESMNPKWEFFPKQTEKYPDLVEMTNHYIIPRLAATYPSLGGGKKDSLDRYETLLGLLNAAYGKIDRQEAMWLIDFLNPARSDYYGTDRTQPIGGHHVLIDNKSLEMWSLHGYYNDPWMHLDLKQYLNN